ncbi:GntR family transcriptional regulator [Hoeflea prorocentri]|uniref:GntR family transcriptional regulator n=1 Tax=Hoeflea prorocentri TaxID=1922333 RepID=A0A9X3ZHZ7_9HYPH|nr:GntR family transcriptional regulator [Hoeflea prorocentri]MCY6381884.1 GntR family transcriptional regulator [Hoeflea prorocentri]MDA5399684.1 GntR family transcriptional regulator [Hoeflea prorocentri]
MQNSENSESLAVKTRAILRKSIESGRLNPGRVIVESTIAELIGASRSPVKTALAALHAEGQLARYAGRGFIIRPDGAELDRRPITAATLGLKPDETGALKVRSSEKLYAIVEPDLVRCAIRGRIGFSEADAATYYGVGRTIMHEVLLTAQANGLARRDRRSRWKTVALNEKRVISLYELRRYLEPHALASAIERLSTEGIERMAADLRRAVKSYPDVSPSDLFKMEEELHIHCVEKCPNKEIVEALRRTRCVHIASRYVLGNEVKLPKDEPFFEEHLKIVRALDSKDGPAVLEEANAHIETALPKLLTRVKLAKEALGQPNLPFLQSQCSSEIL